MVVVIVNVLVAVYLFSDFSQVILWILYSLFYIAPEFPASLFFFEVVVFIFKPGLQGSHMGKCNLVVS